MPASRSIVSLLCALLFAPAVGPGVMAADAKASSLNVLFIGNSFTARHNLSQVVKALAESGNPGLKFNVTTVIYGGRTLADHWRLGTPSFVKLHALTRAEEESTLASLQEALAKNPKDKYLPSAVAKHRTLLTELGKPHPKWDVIVLQSYRDDLKGDASPYVEYAPKYAELAHAQGARVILYETTPTTQNEKPLAAAPDPAPIMQKERVIAALADRIDAAVAPMALVGLRCQTERPDLTLRFVNDGHLNQTMAYLTACTLYAAFFHRSPEGLPIDTVTDTRRLDDDPKNKDKDRDGNPLKRKFSAKDRAELQKIAWEGFNAFEKLRKSGARQ